MFYTTSNKSTTIIFVKIQCNLTHERKTHLKKRKMYFIKIIYSCVTSMEQGDKLNAFLTQNESSLSEAKVKLSDV